MSLFKELQSAAERDKLRLHTPGHKGKLAPLDLTELTDDSFPYPALAEAEERAAKAYGAKHARYLCGGSSQGVKSAIYYAGKNAVVDINSHRAVFDGFTLAGKSCITAGEKNVYPLTVKQIEKALTSETQAVVVTTPTYYGYCADADGIKDFCKKRGLMFIADSAHGAHFGFCKRLPKSVAPIADICNVSTHKTLSALTQTAVLLDNLTDSESTALGEIVDIMGTTSPSYLLYASIDHAVREATTTAAAAYEALYEPINELKAELPFLNNDDFTRLVLDCSRLGISPQKLNGFLACRGVYSEKVDGKHIVFIFTADNTPSDVAAFKNALNSSIRELT